MTDTDLKHLEKKLQVTLPASYREFMLGYPAELAREAGDAELFANATALLTLNDEARTTPFYQNRPWPEHLFVIGENDRGDYYFLDLQDAHGAIMFVDHETMDFRRIAANAVAWAPTLLKEKQDAKDAGGGSV